MSWLPRKSVKTFVTKTGEYRFNLRQQIIEDICQQPFSYRTCKLLEDLKRTRWCNQLFESDVEYIESIVLKVRREFELFYFSSVVPTKFSHYRGRVPYPPPIPRKFAIFRK